MITLIYGNDTKSKSIEINKISKGVIPLVIPTKQISKDLVLSYASQSSLFGDKQTIVMDNALNESDVVFDDELLQILKDSETQFIFNEDAITATELKKYKKYFDKEIKHELEKVVVKKGNPFDIANAFGAKDKIKAWTLYVSIIEGGEAPEAVAGMLFWKIKTLLSGYSPKPFTKDELLNASAELVDIYHKAHRGECDMEQALEQFILKTL
jgi:DNA polymerase III delta subunit